MAAVTVAGKTPTPRFIYDCVAPPHICIFTPGAEMREEEKEHLEEREGWAGGRGVTSEGHVYTLDAEFTHSHSVDTHTQTQIHYSFHNDSVFALWLLAVVWRLTEGGAFLINADCARKQK